ncbi:hypothetical protein ACHAXA_007843 [Cyclostephanos tholiformis]|uniref:Mitochondrial import inner membrane translocase subunit TIM50 n=1 Tax=Cyclostephanos tholiformis TaxID=382380 RepID=A0ABD3SBZ8_9STRA
MATASNRAAVQTALLSVRGLRRRRLGHISPTDYPQNGLDKWGHAATRGGVLSGGGGGRPVPRASLVLGGEKPLNRRRGGLNGSAMAGGLTNMNGGGGGGGGGGDAQADIRRLVSSTMMDQRESSANTVAWDGQRCANEPSSRTCSLPPGTNVDDSSIRPSNDGNITCMAGGSTVVLSNDESKKRGKYSSDLIVVLDMDECLIHSQFLSDRLVDKYRQVEDRPPTPSSEHSSHQGVDNDNKNNYNNNIRAEAESSLSLNACDSFRISLPDGDMVNVNKRPNLDIFLKEITSKFETYIFTAAMEVYAAPVLNELDPNGDMFRGRFYREHCVYDPDLGVYSKNLCDVLRMRQMMIGDTAVRHKGGGMPLNHAHRDNVGSSSSLSHSFPCDERRVVLVDNNPLSFLPNPSNGILVSSFYDDPKDDTLEAVMELLHELDGSDDVRPILDDRFGLKDALEDVVKGGSIRW